MIDLSLLDKSKTTALVIRHADRDKMEQWQIEQPLNDDGKKHAEELGEKLRGFKNYTFFTSSVDRCQETVDFMQRGIFQAGEKQSAICSDVLGRPGIFVIDRNNNAFKSLSCRKVVTNQIAHEKLDGIRDTEEGARLFTEFITGKMRESKNGTLLVFVTHDAIIAPVIFELTGEKFGYENWPAFADGFLVEENDGEFKVIRNKKIFDLRKF